MKKIQQQRGVALVITLIMLSVITFLAVAFLALSRRERAAMATSSNQTDSRLAADFALARAQSEIIARIITETNMLVGDMMVSKAFINTNGFIANNTDVTNVNHFTNAFSGSPLSASEHIQNVANLYYDPIIPVYIPTNANGSSEFRYYYDFNRNGRYDTNGSLFPVDDQNVQIGTNRLDFTGDPMWVGILEKPEFRHSGTNRALARYMYFVSPEGRTLDVNFMHNYGKGLDINMNTGDGFFRNQNVGSWEMNLAGFFAGLNTNYWAGTSTTNSYFFDGFNLNKTNSGPAFSDAFSILTNRYSSTNTVAGLPSARVTLHLDTVDKINDFKANGIDEYANGPLTTNYTSHLTNDVNEFDTPPWAGSRNTNFFANIDQLFDSTKTSPALVARLRDMATHTNSYDRYTFNRLISQLGTYSVPATNVVIAGKNYRKINLNHDNYRTNFDGAVSPTNYFAWTPISFFTNAAELLIQQGIERQGKTNFLGGIRVPTNFALANIQIYPTNEYTPTLHRLLQLAANIYAATTNDFITNGAFQLKTNFPFVFRPQFSRTNIGTTDAIIISGFEEVTGTNAAGGRFLDRKLVADRNFIANFPGRSSTNVFGVPWVISAKKGFPNFNEYSMETVFEVSRKLLVTNVATFQTPSFRTNQMLLFSVTNRFGAEFWNSYMTNYPNDVEILTTNYFAIGITNHTRPLASPLLLTNFSYATNFPVNAPWQGVYQRQGGINPNSFIPLTLTSNSFVTTLAPSQFTNALSGSPSFVRIGNGKSNFDRNETRPYGPTWQLLITNRFVCAMIDKEAQRIIDFVNFDGFVGDMDVLKVLTEPNLPDPLNGTTAGNISKSVWRTNYVRTGSPYSTMEGHDLQMRISIGDVGLNDQILWKEVALPGYVDANTRYAEVSKFRRFMGFSPLPGYPVTNTALAAFAPFSPTRRMYIRMGFEANDPLVHYQLADMINPKDFDGISVKPGSDTQSLLSSQRWATTNKLGSVNDRYRPWGESKTPGSVDLNNDLTSHVSRQDPMVRWSDDWDFPTNKFPNIGWLGRVHRGTPWQTIYMKSGISSTNRDDAEAWYQWAGTEQTHPTNDWRFFDLFTTAPNDDAARGLLSVNQPGMAAWSAVLIGVCVLTNDSNGNLDPGFIEPATPEMDAIVNSINAARQTRSNGLFTATGDILAAPQLTALSPYLNTTNYAFANFLPDAVYERIPQQIMSLLKLGESRFVVYSIGQSLKPAPNSIVFDPQYPNICTNYQVTGEVATRTVLRFEGSAQRPKAVIESFQILSEQ